MAAMQPGCIYLSCRASLEQPCPLEGDLDTVLFDGLLFCTKAVNKMCVIAASLRYCKDDNGDDVFKPGIFDLCAIVALTPTLFACGNMNSLHLGCGLSTGHKQTVR